MKTQKIILNIAGMHCEACAKVIKMTLEDQQGVIWADVDDVMKKATIQFDTELITSPEIIDLISSLGYQANLM